MVSSGWSEISRALARAMALFLMAHLSAAK
jgi:hypothetical protein